MVSRVGCLVTVLGLTLLGCDNTVPPDAEPAATELAAVDAARLIAADTEPGQWLSHGRTYGEQRFSPLVEINPQTVGRLALTWFADLDTRRGQEATPLVADGVLYVSTAWSKVKAYNAATGLALWSYDPEVPGEWAVNACCDVVNRGVALWEGKVFVGSLDGRLIALDAGTGRELWDVNTIDRTKPYTITGAPRVIKGKVLIGNGGAEFGVRGYVSAYDADTGKLAWRFYTVPGNPAGGFENPAMEMAAATWRGEWWALGGGGTVWDSMAYDPELDLLYIGVGNGSPWNHGLRSEGTGDNLFLASIVALDPDDGSYVWHYQTSPGESWDHTATQQIVVADLTLNGTPRRVVMQAPKNGFFYVLDAKTGELISAEPFTAISWATHVSKETGRPVETPQARFYRTEQPFASLQPPNGAHTWHSMSFSPATGLMYIPIHMQEFIFNHEPAFAASSMTTNLGIRRGTQSADPAVRDAAAQAARDSARGRLIAWDPVTQREVWRSERDGPANGGALSTAGGLVFQGTGTGRLLALDANTGATLWSAEAQTGVIAAPVSYAVAGVQYVAVMVGRGGSWAMAGDEANAKGNNLPNISRLLVFALDGTAELPPVPPPPVRELTPPRATAASATVAHGEAVYGTYCGRCHGRAGAANFGILPDLRYSATLGTSAAWAAVVLDGQLAPNGMASFASVISADDADAIRAYVISQAHAARAAGADHRDAEYVIEGRRIRLIDGAAETEAAPGSASKIRTRYFGNEARRDLNGDGRDDVVFLLTQDTGGTGVFYYVVAALDTAQGYVGSQALLLGDRIAPQATELGANNIVTVSFAERAPGESFATPPSQAKSIRLLLDTATLQFGEVAQNFEGEANPATMKLDMKTWVWVGARYEDGREILPRRAEAFTLTFGADGQFSAATDCNRVGGAYAAVGDRLTFSGVFATRMFCDGAQETEFTALLTSTTGYRFTSRGQLMLDLESGRGSAEFR